MSLKPDREKYLKMAKNEGVGTAITALHDEMEQIEQDTFEGPDGYQRGLYDDLKEFRALSRELWSIRYDLDDSMLRGG